MFQQTQKIIFLLISTSTYNFHSSCFFNLNSGELFFIHNPMTIIVVIVDIPCDSVMAEATSPRPLLLFGDAVLL